MSSNCTMMQSLAFTHSGNFPDKSLLPHFCASCLTLKSVACYGLNCHLTRHTLAREPFVLVCQYWFLKMCDNSDKKSARPQRIAQ